MLLLRNKGLEKCSGEFIAFLDVDDYWLPTKLEEQIKLFRNTEIGFSCTNSWKINERIKKRNKLGFKKIYSGSGLNDIRPSLKKLLKSKKMLTNVGDEGGFAPNIKSNHEAIEIVLQSIEKAGYKPGEDILIAMDAAASEFYNAEEKVYHFASSTGDKLTSSEMVDYWKSWVDKYPILSIEDGLDEDVETGISE